MPDEPLPTRRDFLSIALGAWGAAAAAGAAAVVGASAVPPAEAPRSVRVKKADLKDGYAAALLGGRPIGVMVGAEGPVAFSLSCTHARCIVAWEPAAKNFACPCHGGKYDASGKVLAGPPPQPLLRLKIADVGDAYEVTG